MICPCCGSREVGYLPANQYYCWQCFVQFVVGDNSAEVYEVEEDGTLVSLGRVGLEHAGLPVMVSPPARSVQGLEVGSLKPGR